MEGTVAPGMCETSVADEQRHAWVLHWIFLSAPIQFGAVIFLSLLADAADTMARYDASFAEVVGVSAQIGLGYPSVVAVVHGTMAALILRGRPWTTTRVASVHAGLVVGWAVLFYFFLLAMDP